MLPPAPGGAFTWFSYDGLPVAVALDAQDEMADAVNIRWGRSRLEVLERGKELCLCRHVESGRVLEVLTDYLREGPEGTFCEDSTDYRPPVAPGERLGVVKVLSHRALVKRKGATGWYFGRLAPFCPEMPE